MKILKIASIGTKTTLRKILLSSAIVVLFAAFNANASDEVSSEFIYDYNLNLIVYAKIDDVKIPVYKVFDYQSKTENYDDYVIEISEKMRDFTDKTGFEACSTICSKIFDGKESLSAIVVTAKSSLFCPIIDSCPAGYQKTSYDIHTHPKKMKYKPSDVDLKIFDNGKSIVSSTTSPEMFSSADMESDSSYLITPKKVKKFEYGKITVISEY